MNTSTFVGPILLSSVLFACGAQPASTPATPPSGTTDATPATPAAAVPTTAAQGSNNTVEGHALTPRSAASAVYADDVNALVLVVSNQADYCGTLTAGQTRANDVALAAQLLSLSDAGDSVVIAPGTYAVVATPPEMAGDYALAALQVSDGNCASAMQDPNDVATSGTVTITSMSDTTISGSYNVNFSGGSVAGTFVAPVCPALAAQVKDSPDLTCEP